jgi:hypothetical protein
MLSKSFVELGHNFERGTTRVHGPRPTDIFTEFHCKNCGSTFRHFYHITPNLNEALEINPFLSCFNKLEEPTHV